MSHFAKVCNGVVVQVIVAEPEFFNNFVDNSPGEWLQTSYNTRGNVHYLPDSNTPSGKPAFRGNYAGMGYTYNYEKDVFYASKPFPSWILDENTWIWNPPIPMPLDGKMYIWDEPTTSWIERIKE